MRMPPVLGRRGADRWDFHASSQRGLAAAISQGAGLLAAMKRTYRSDRDDL